MKVQCECRHLIHDGADELAHKAHVIPDQCWPALLDALDELIETECSNPAARDRALTTMRNLVSGASRFAWQCTNCGAVYIDDPEHDAGVFRPVHAERAAGILSAGAPSGSKRK